MEQSYKEKYEQALAKAKEQYNYPCMRSCMGILEEIFPELKESEDEKIRKEIVRFIQMEVEDEIVGNKWLAWLEKQGQVKESAISQHEIETCKENVNSLTSEDEKMIESLIESLTRISANTRTDSTSPNYTFYKEIDWLKSLKDRLQPKQEWSEEDSYYRNNIIQIIEEINNAPLKRGEDWEAYINWLKSLRPQNRWKPSEDDIIILEKLIKGELEPKVFQATLQGILEQLKKLKEKV